MAIIESLTQDHRDYLSGCPTYEVFSDCPPRQKPTLLDLVDTEVINIYTSDPHPDRYTYELSPAGRLIKNSLTG